MPRFRLASVRSATLAALLASLAFAGCGDEEPTDAPADPADEQAAADPAGPSGPAAPAEPISTIGTFRLITASRGQANNFGSLTVVAGEEGPTLKAFKPTGRLAEMSPQFTLIEATDDALSFQIQSEKDATVDLRFDGKPIPGAVIGALHDPVGQTILPAALVPLPAGEPNPGPPMFSDPSFQQIVRAIGEVSPTVEGLRTVAKRSPNSPVFFDLFPPAVVAEMREGRSPEVMQPLIDDYVAFAAGWGPWTEASARREIARYLISSPRYRALAEAQLDAAIAALPESASDEAKTLWTNRFEELLAEADRRQEQSDLVKRLTDAMKLGREDADQALADLRAIHEEHADDPATLYMLAEGLFRYAGDDRVAELSTLQEANPLEAVPAYLLAEAKRAAGDDDGARALFARAASIPLGSFYIESLLSREKPEGEETPDYDFAQPRERLAAELEDEQAVADLLTETYVDLAKGLAGEPRAADDNQRVVLGELFTGARCPPCVAADMATTALAHEFPTEDLIVLQYHVHVPQPDPLANEDAVDRFDDLGFRGTPTFRLDGLDPNVVVGGPATGAPDVFAALAAATEDRRAVPPGATVSVEATVDGGRIELKAKAEREDGFAATHRLHVAIAEDNVRYAAPNGIRTHEMLVRALPTGDTGVQPDGEGALSYRLDTTVADLREELAAYLARYEREQRNLQFPDKPLDLTRLTAVAWVADRETGEVLQSAFAPLGEFPPPASPDAPAEATDESATPPEAEAPDADDADDSDDEEGASDEAATPAKDGASPAESAETEPTGTESTETSEVPDAEPVATGEAADGETEED